MNVNMQRKPFEAVWALCLCVLLLLPALGMAEIVLPDRVGQPLENASPASPDVARQPGTSQPPVHPEAPPVPEIEYKEPAREAADALAASVSSMLPSQHDEMMHSQHIGEMLTGILIPVLAISLIFGGPVVLVIVLAILHYRAKARRERTQGEYIARLIDAGRDVPAELLRGDEALTDSSEENLRKGVKNIGVGTGLLLFLTLLIDIGIGAVGFILIGLGISQLVVWKLADRKAVQSISQD